MIVYFSATGNSKITALRIAEALGDTAVSVEDAPKKYALSYGEVFGFVTPVYWWQLPTITREYLRRLTLRNAGYTFLVVTYGTTTGCCGEDARRILKKRGITLDAAFSVRMPDSFTPMFDLSDPVKVKAEQIYAQQQTARLILRLKARQTGDQTARPVPYPVRIVMSPMFDRFRQTKHFYVEDQCIGCGLCEEKCPVNAIKIIDGKPVWTKDKCALCLGCLHRCPKFAIQYSMGFSKTHGQYVNNEE